MENTTRYDIPGTKMEVVVPGSTNLDEFLTNRLEGGVDLYELERGYANRKVPDNNDRMMNLNTDRMTTGDPRGTFQLAIRAERVALNKGLKNYLPDINNRFKANITTDDIDNITKYIPNSRFAYYNKLLKHILKTGVVRQGDLDFVRTIWMNDQARASLYKIFNAVTIDQSPGFSVEPTQSRSGMKVYDVAGDKLAIKLANPGLVVPQNSFSNVRTLISEHDEGALDSVFTKYLSNLQDLEHKLNLDMSTLPLEDLPESNITRNILRMRDILGRRHIRGFDLEEIARSLNKLIGTMKSEYLLSLANPFDYGGVRVPSEFSPPSATFTLKTMIPLTTNTSGNVAFSFSPFWLASGSQSSFYINNNVGLTGTASSNFFTAINVGQTLPASFYTKYRVVTAGVRLFNFPSSNNDNGMATISTTFEDPGVFSPGTVNPDLQGYGNFSMIDNGYYRKTTTVASRDVLESSYIPLDSLMLDYVNIQVQRPGYLWIGYITGAAPSATIARMEIVVNYEALVNNDFADYLPTASHTESIPPKMIFGVIERLKKSRSALGKTEVESILKEQSILPNPQSEITIPEPKPDRRSIASRIEELGSDVTKITQAVAPFISEDLKKTWLQKLMSFVSPLASRAVEAAAQHLKPNWYTLGKGLLL